MFVNCSKPIYIPFLQLYQQWFYAIQSQLYFLIIKVNDNSYIGKNYTCAQAKIKVFAHNTVYFEKASFWLYLMSTTESE